MFTSLKKANSIKTGVFLSLAFIFTAHNAQAQQVCEREELGTTIDNYFSALAAHDPDEVSIARNTRFTENGYELKVGEGLWETAGETVLTHSALDTETCGTVTLGLIKENGRDIIFGVRLKLNERKEISEIEHIIAREDDFAFTPQGILNTSQQDWEGIQPADARTSRAAMRAAANDYYDMFTDTPEVNVPFGIPCERWENGFKTTRGDCSPKGLTIIHGDRRVPVVDEEAGIAVAFIHFAGNLPDMHMFKFYKGHVYQVQAVIGTGGAGSTGWPDDTSLSRRTPPEGEVMSPSNLGED